jgi:homogentisate phytyltransferase/homogentisate geranylgeranyltransferase
MALAGPLALDSVQPAVLAGTHLAVLCLLWAMSARADPRDPASFTTFYMRVWKLFFLEYALVPLAVLLA